MRKGLIALAAVVALAAPQARASEGAEQRFKLGVGLGFGMPYGDALKGQSLASIYMGEIPIDVDFSYRITPSFSAGVYGGYAYGLVSRSGRVTSSTYTSEVVDGIATWRFGVQAEYEFGKMGAAMPFLAARVGYVTETLKGKNGVGDSTASGWEYLTLIGGVDFQVAPRFTVGPFLSGALGEYTDEKLAGGSSQSIPDGDRTLHGWITIGVRGTWGF